MDDQSVPVTFGGGGQTSAHAVVFALTLTLTLALAGNAVVVETASSAAGDRPDARPIAAAQSDENNTTVRHVDPDEVSEDRDASDLKLWLAREMSGKLSESLDIGQADRERARELIDDDSEYADLGRRYEEVDREERSDEARDGGLATLPELRDVQRTFFADVDRYWGAFEDYRQARERGNETRERELAHVLERRADRIGRTADRLNRSYGNASSIAEVDPEEANRTVGRIRANVTQAQAEVRNQTLTPTRLSVELEDGNGSFADPIRLTGQLRTESGDGLADENVTLRGGNRTLHRLTDEDGEFELAYRPVTAPVGERSLTVQHRPANDSVYLGDSASAGVVVEQVSPEVRLSNTTERVEYDDTLTLDGTVESDGVGVPSVPVDVTVGEVRLARTRTAQNGSYGVSTRVPANVSADSERVRIRVLPNRTNLAIASANATSPLVVEETPTSLTIDTVEHREQTVFVSGRLTADEGPPLANRTVLLRAGGTAIGTAITNATGRYATTTEIPSNLLDDETLEITAASSVTGNLRPSRANETVALGGGEPVFPDRWTLLGAVSGLGVIGILVILGLRGSDWTAFDARSSADSEPARTSASRRRAEESADALLDAATEYLAEGRFDDATAAAYVSARSRLGTDGGVGRTHREFLEDCRNDGLSPDRLRELERLTAAYERATFAPEPIPEAAADGAVAAATALRSADESDSPTGSAE